MASSAAGSPNLGLGNPSTFSTLDPSRSRLRDASDPSKPPKDPAKVIIRFKATGNAPIMRQSVFKITASHRFQAVHAFLRTQLNLKPSDPLFLYLNSSFAPAPDDVISSLLAPKQSYGTEGQLNVNYSSTQAWG